MKQRIISGVILAAVMLTALFCGGFPLWFIVAVIACFSMFELYRAAGVQNDKRTWICYPIVIAILLLCKKLTVPIVIIDILVITFMTIYVVVYPRIQFSPSFIIVLGVFYVGVLAVNIFLNRSFEDGIYYSLVYLIGCCGTDVFAYFIGSKFGKQHPFPVLSPKKSVEGCIGGAAVSTALGIALALIMKKPVPAAILLHIVVAIFSEIGDLAASGIKRQFGIKDYGNVIPGHGGFLDRFDSSLFAGGVIFVCVTLLY